METDHLSCIFLIVWWHILYLAWLQLIRKLPACNVWLKMNVGSLFNVCNIFIREPILTICFINSEGSSNNSSANLVKVDLKTVNFLCSKWQLFKITSRIINNQNDQRQQKFTAVIDCLFASLYISLWNLTDGKFVDLD